jgi:hypothetical protein
MYMQRHAGILAILVGLLLVYGCGKDKDTPAPAPQPDVPKTVPSEQPPKDDTVKTPVEPPKGVRPAYTVTAIGITEEFGKNRMAAEEKYTDKIVQVEGTVSSVTHNSVQRKTDVSLAGYKTAGEPLAQQVVCIIKKSLVGKASLLGKGQQLIMKGKFDSDSGGNVILKNVEYKERTSSSVPRMPAEQLAKAFADDKAAAAKKYAEKEVIVEGTVIDLMDNGVECVAKLAGTRNIAVTCTLDDDEFKTLKKGEKVQIKGEVSLFSGKAVKILPAYLVNR